MPVYQGTKYSRNIILTDNDDVPFDITGWEFAADIKENRADTVALASLTTANGGFEVTSAAAGQLTMTISADNSALLPVGRMVFDVLRTDVDGPVYYFGGSFPVKKPVTTP